MEYVEQPTISVIEPIGKAVEKTKEILFQPFAFKKWCVIGFCAFLAMLGEGGGGGNFNFGGGGGNGGSGGGGGAEVKAWFMENLYWIIPVAIALFLIIIVISIVLCWLRSRGKFMFLHCVARNRADIAWPWTTYAQQGNSLFVFRLVLGFLSFLCVLPFIALIIFSIFLLAEAQAIAGGVLLIIFSALLLISACICFGIISKFTSDFIVPIMLLRYCRVMDAWREFLVILKANKGKFALYILFQIVIGLVIGAITGFVTLITCCFCCTLFIPVVGWYIAAVVFLPLSTFARSYSLIYLSQYGPEYNVFVPMTAAAEPAPVDSEDDGFKEGNGI